MASPTTGRRAPRKLALESRAFPYLTFDPDAGAAIRRRADASTAIRRSIDAWPTYTLEYVDDSGEECSDGRFR